MRTEIPYGDWPVKSQPIILWISKHSFGGDRFENPFVLEEGYFSSCLDPGELTEKIEKALRSDRLSERMRKRLTEVQTGITENDNNYLLYAKLKQ